MLLGMEMASVVGMEVTSAIIKSGDDYMLQETYYKLRVYGSWGRMN